MTEDYVTIKNQNREQTAVLLTIKPFVTPIVVSPTYVMHETSETRII